MKLDRQTVRAVAVLEEPVFDQYPLQLGMHGCPWRVALASMLLCRTRREQAEPALRELLAQWPTLGDIARAEGVEAVVRPCGLHRQRARQIQRFAVEYMGDWWQDMRELPGVGVYVADAVSLFCFGCKDIASNDYALVGYARTLTP